MPRIANRKNKKLKKSKVRKATKEVNKIEQIILQPPRGMKDILPDEQPYWDQVRKISEKLARDYGFSRLDMPLVEFSNLYVRSVGEGTDIVDKEMYNFVTRGGDKVALRP